jgi:hypothetical protein
MERTMRGFCWMAAELDLEGEIDPPAPAMERSGSGNWFGGGDKAFPAVHGSPQLAGLERHLWVSQTPWFCKINLK